MIGSIETNLPSSTSSDVRDAHTFYNNPQEHGLDQRNESKIVHMRNFNNWIKSTLINEYLQRIRREQPERKDDINVFDMGCGKGGDQLKWDIGRVKFVTFADLTENSVEVCKQRYHERRNRCSYKAEFFPLDCTKEFLGDKIKTNEPRYDLVSTQFVIHYSFDKLESADRFLRNAAEFLRVGGYFIGTTVNSYDLVERCRNSPNQSISNDVFKISFDSSINLSKTSNELIPLFGAKYHFSLDELVDCPEYLVYFPLLEHLAKKHGLEMVNRQTFKDYFNLNEDNPEGRSLLVKMKALESYELPTDNQGHQRGPPIDQNQYTHAQKHINEINKQRSKPMEYCGTLSKQEWEITSLYIIFAFKKIKQVNYNEDTITSH